MATLNDVERLAAQLNITFTDYAPVQAFDLDSKPNAPLQFEGTYRKVQVGIDGAYSDLVKHQANLSNAFQAMGPLLSNHQRSIGASGALGLSFLAALVVYTIGTFYPETRGITGPLTILFMILIVVSAVILALGHARK